jgi:hypothetical protein
VSDGDDDLVPEPADLDTVGDGEGVHDGVPLRIDAVTSREGELLTLNDAEPDRVADGKSDAEAVGVRYWGGVREWDSDIVGVSVPVPSCESVCELLVVRENVGDPVTESDVDTDLKDPEISSESLTVKLDESLKVLEREFEASNETDFGLPDIDADRLIESSWEDETEGDPDRDEERSSVSDCEGVLVGPDREGDCVLDPMEFVLVTVTSVETLPLRDSLIEADLLTDTSSENETVSETVTDWLFETVGDSFVLLEVTSNVGEPNESVIVTVSVWEGDAVSVGESVNVGDGDSVVVDDNVIVPVGEVEYEHEISSVLLTVTVCEIDKVMVRIVFDCSDVGLGVDVSDPDSIWEAVKDDDCDEESENDGVSENDTAVVRERDCDAVTDLESDDSSDNDGDTLVDIDGELESVTEAENESEGSRVSVMDLDADDVSVGDCETVALSVRLCSCENDAVRLFDKEWLLVLVTDLVLSLVCVRVFDAEVSFVSESVIELSFVLDAETEVESLGDGVRDGVVVMVGSWEGDAVTDTEELGCSSLSDDVMDDDMVDDWVADLVILCSTEFEGVVLKDIEMLLLPVADGVEVSVRETDGRDRVSDVVTSVDSVTDALSDGDNVIERVNDLLRDVDVVNESDTVVDSVMLACPEIDGVPRERDRDPLASSEMLSVIDWVVDAVVVVLVDVDGDADDVGVRLGVRESDELISFVSEPNDAVFERLCEYDVESLNDIVMDDESDRVRLSEPTEVGDSVMERCSEKLPNVIDFVTELLCESDRDALLDLENDVVTVVVSDNVCDFETDNSSEPPVRVGVFEPVTDAESSFVADPNEAVLESDAVEEGPSWEGDWDIDVEEEPPTEGVTVNDGDGVSVLDLEPSSWEFDGVILNDSLTDDDWDPLSELDDVAVGEGKSVAESLIVGDPILCVSVTVGVSENVSLNDTEASDADLSSELDTVHVLEAVIEVDGRSLERDGVELGDRLLVRLMEPSWESDCDALPNNGEAETEFDCSLDGDVEREFVVLSSFVTEGRDAEAEREWVTALAESSREKDADLDLTVVVFVFTAAVGRKISVVMTAKSNIGTRGEWHPFMVKKVYWWWCSRNNTPSF